MKGAIAVEHQPSALFLLTDLESVLDKLLETAQRKQGLVVSGDVKGLQELLQKEDEMLMELHSLKARINEGALSSPKASLGPEIQGLKDKVGRKALRLKNLNGQNQVLLSKSLEMVRYELGLFIPQNDYSKAAKSPPIAFDKKM